ncbi:MAG: hypothetical protein DCF19_01230 [Pseudanabaena frigida]|uniref:Uncharacterized protein n=1 Tax=Pseudanabaena frigida TaxID=945775 RepID=A0A2W4WKZ7_9CYAN|nr:MAG: hypothetical protein DCF19_01230 [Pseudanabaena frigida]
MTTKKKVGISDLLRDEVQKGTESPISNDSSEKTIEVKAETVAEADSKVVTSPAINAAEKSPKAKNSALDSELAQFQKRETELLQTIADLQKDLKFSQTNVELLQKSLTAIEGVKNELDRQLVEVKRDNLRLAEANIQLSEQIKASESVPTPAAIEPPVSSQLVSQSPQQQNRATPRKQPVEQPYPHRDRTPYARPTGSNEQLQRVNNKNIGWMD